MTRKDFELIASVIRNMPTFSPRMRTAQQEYASAFAVALKATNPKFNAERFISACIPERSDDA